MSGLNRTYSEPPCRPKPIEHSTYVLLASALLYLMF